MTATLQHSLSDVREAFTGGRDYLSAWTSGLPTRATRAAVIADLDAASVGALTTGSYATAAENCRAHFARLVRVDSDRIAIGSQTSVLASLLAASLPDGAEVLVPNKEFSSIVLPFVHAGRRIHIRSVPLESLADEIRPSTALVAFSLVQSSTGAVADSDAIEHAARAASARLLCDATQAVGWLPVDADRYDALVCHAYKWLCTPRGVAFLALSEEYAATLRPSHAGWCAGEDPWASCYGHEVDLAVSARRFDVSPAWQALVAAEPALELFARADRSALREYTTALATRFRERMGLEQPERASAIVTWCDPDGRDLAALAAAGITASGRDGRARVAFHVFNDSHDVERAVAALGR